MNAIRTVGLIGLGKMGCPMARHMIAGGYRVIGYDPLSDACGAAAALGAASASDLSPAFRAGNRHDQPRDDRLGAVRRPGVRAEPLGVRRPRRA